MRTEAERIVVASAHAVYTVRAKHAAPNLTFYGHEGEGYDSVHFLFQRGWDLNRAALAFRWSIALPSAVMCAAPGPVSHLHWICLGDNQLLFSVATDQTFRLSVAIC